MSAAKRRHHSPSLQAEDYRYLLRKKINYELQRKRFSDINLTKSPVRKLADNMMALKKRLPVHKSSSRGELPNSSSVFHTRIRTLLSKASGIREIIKSKKNNSEETETMQEIEETFFQITFCFKGKKRYCIYCMKQIKDAIKKQQSINTLK